MLLGPLFLPDSFACHNTQFPRCCTASTVSERGDLLPRGLSLHPFAHPFHSLIQPSEGVKMNAHPPLRPRA